MDEIERRLELDEKKTRIIQWVVLVFCVAFALVVTSYASYKLGQQSRNYDVQFAEKSAEQHHIRETELRHELEERDTEIMTYRVALTTTAELMGVCQYGPVTGDGLILRCDYESGTVYGPDLLVHDYRFGFNEPARPLELED